MLSPDVRINPFAYLIQPVVDATVHRQANGAFVIRWAAPADHVQVYVGLSPTTIDRATRVASASHAQEIVVTGLANARLYFELVFNTGQSIIVAERVLPLDNSLNLRDIGGYRTAAGRRVQWGKIFRSGEIHHLHEHDLLRTIRPRLVYDLRGADELTSGQAVLPADITYLNLPVAAPAFPLQKLLAALMQGNSATASQLMMRSYTAIFDHAAPLLQTLLNHLARAENLPAIIHCTAGKDRTGVTIALLLALLGVPESTIIADYSLSNLAFNQLMTEAARNPRLAAAGIAPDTVAPILRVDPAWMRHTLDHLNTRYGGAERYARQHLGLTSNQITAIRNHLLH